MGCKHFKTGCFKDLFIKKKEQLTVMNNKQLLDMVYSKSNIDIAFKQFSYQSIEKVVVAKKRTSSYCITIEKYMTLFKKLMVLLPPINIKCQNNEIFDRNSFKAALRMYNTQKKYVM